MLKLKLIALFAFFLFGLAGCEKPEEAMLNLMADIAQTAEENVNNCSAQAQALTRLLDDRQTDIKRAQSLPATNSNDDMAAENERFSSRRIALTERTVRAMRRCAHTPELAAALRRL